MDLPFTRSKFDRLGKRLAKAETIDPADLELLERAYDTYNRVLQFVRVTLEAAGYSPVVRLKTTGTLVDKLRRSPGLSISHINDIAGARLLVDRVKIPAGISLSDSHIAREDTWVEAGPFAQDVTTRLVLGVYSRPGFSEKPPKVIDRLGEGTDSSGYRAIHVIVYPHGVPVEIQIRTRLQHMWAEISERLGDRWGRGLRYGSGPREPDRPIVSGAPVTRAMLVRHLVEISDLVRTYENAVKELERWEITMSFLEADSTDYLTLANRTSEIRPDVTVVHEEIRARLKVLLDAVDRLE